MFDLLDLLHGKVNYTFTGVHYSRRPDTPDQEGGGIFDYEYVDPTEWHYQKLLGNLINSDGATATIKTNDDMQWKPGEFIVLQDDKLYTIVSVMKDYQSESKQTFRFLKEAPEIDYVVRLVEVENSWGIGE